MTAKLTRLSNYDKVLQSAPVDKLARSVTSGGSSLPDAPAYAVLLNENLRMQARQLKKITGRRLTECKDEICRAAGYKGFQDYVRVLKSRDEFHNYQDLLRKKHALKSAEREAARLCEAEP